MEKASLWPRPERPDLSLGRGWEHPPRAPSSLEPHGVLASLGRGGWQPQVTRHLDFSGRAASVQTPVLLQAHAPCTVTVIYGIIALPNIDPGPWEQVFLSWSTEVAGTH